VSIPLPPPGNTSPPVFGDPLPHLLVISGDFHQRVVTNVFLRRLKTGLSILHFDPTLSASNLIPIPLPSREHSTSCVCTYLFLSPSNVFSTKRLLLSGVDPTASSDEAFENDRSYFPDFPPSFFFPSVNCMVPLPISLTSLRLFFLPCFPHRESHSFLSSYEITDLSQDLRVGIPSSPSSDWLGLRPHRLLLFFHMVRPVRPCFSVLLFGPPQLLLVLRPEGPQALRRSSRMRFSGFAIFLLIYPSWRPPVVSPLGHSGHTGAARGVQLRFGSVPAFSSPISC